VFFLIKTHFFFNFWGGGVFGRELSKVKIKNFSLNFEFWRYDP